MSRYLQCKSFSFKTHTGEYHAEYVGGITFVVSYIPAYLGGYKEWNIGGMQKCVDGGNWFDIVYDDELEMNIKTTFYLESRYGSAVAEKLDEEDLWHIRLQPNRGDMWASNEAMQQWLLQDGYTLIAVTNGPA